MRLRQQEREQARQEAARLKAEAEAAELEGEEERAAPAPRSPPAAAAEAPAPAPQGRGGDALRSVEETPMGGATTAVSGADAYLQALERQLAADASATEGGVEPSGSMAECQVCGRRFASER